MSFRRLLYTLFLYFIFPLVLIRLLWRSRANKEYRLRWSERLGFIAAQAKITDSQDKLWLHAVSVGEVIAAKPLILSLFDKFPEHCLIVTTTTPTGSNRVTEIFADQIRNRQLIHVYLPYDLLGSISRFLNAFKPKLLVMVETEIWTNLYVKCNRRGIPIIMVNARLSDKSMQAYLKIKGLVAETLSNVSIIAVRSEADAARFMKLGAQPKQIEKAGNIKYDLQIDQVQIDNGKMYKQLKNQKNVLVAASTHEGEDAKILLAYKALLKEFPDLLLILVPRHPERFIHVFETCLEQLPEESQVIKHSEYDSLTTIKASKINVIVGDSMGEMQMWYSLADVVFIGGSLVEVGGHNPLEATVFGVPVFSGPYMYNFEDIALELERNGLLTVCSDELALIKQVSQCLGNLIFDSTKCQNREQYKITANSFMQQHQGVTARLVKLIKSLIH